MIALAPFVACFVILAVLIRRALAQPERGNDECVKVRK
jgi:hypothetical protein